MSKLTFKITSKDYLASLQAKVVELEAHLAAMAEGHSIDGKQLSANTIKTQTFLKQRERNNVQLVMHLLENKPDFMISERDLSTLEYMCSSIKANTKSTLHVSKGQTVMEIMQTSPNATLARIMKAAQAQGLKVDPVTQKLI